ncbi:MAG: DUF1707 domain-containing protein [Nakamurella sp.]
MTAASSESDPSNFRIGDAERNSAMDALGEHLSSGRIDLDEFGTRSAQITQARTVADLNALFTDLPAPHPAIAGLQPAIRPAAAAAPTPPGEVTRYQDQRSAAQRWVAGATAASGIIAVILFFALGLPWWIFLLPAAIGVISSSVWGGDGQRRDRNRDRNRGN